MASLGIGLVPFADAIEWAKSRGIVLPDAFYNDLQEMVKRRAFTVSGLNRIGQIDHVLQSLTVALEQGLSFAQWKGLLANDPDLLALPKGRLETIFRTNMQSAYMAGRWAQFDRDPRKDEKYLVFSAINDSRTSDICRELHGTIRPVNDPFWKDRSPPLHHNCRSTLRMVTREQALKLSGDDSGLNKPPPTIKPGAGFGVKPNTGPNFAGPKTDTALQPSFVNRVRDFLSRLPGTIRVSVQRWFSGLGWA